MTSRAGKMLPREFFRRPTLEVAHELIGKILEVRRNGVSLSGRIVEAEAYIGEDDPACHARFGKTGRNAVMYGDAGHIYVYFIYGMYYMLNFVTEPEGMPAAVLIRALEPLSGLETMKKRRGITNLRQLTNGPGKLCQALALTTADTGQDLFRAALHVSDDGFRPSEIVESTRIGIKEGTDLPWRFFDAANKFVSTRRVPSAV